MFLSKKLYVEDCRKSQLIGFNPYLYWEESSKEEGVYCGDVSNVIEKVKCILKTPGKVS